MSKWEIMQRVADTRKEIETFAQDWADVPGGTRNPLAVADWERLWRQLDELFAALRGCAVAQEETMNKIISNKIRCKKCGDVIESKHVHDFKLCKCGAVGVDGGRDYLRRLGNPDNWEELSETTEEM